MADTGGADAHGRSARPDLAAMIAPLYRALIAAELPVLEAAGLSMWGYIVLLRLSRCPASSQAQLADAIGADRTRIIDVLDDLQQRGWIDRLPDPADRRARLVSITAEGEAVRASAQAGIQRQEQRLLDELLPVDRAAFLRALQALAGLPAAQLLLGGSAGNNPVQG